MKKLMFIALIAIATMAVMASCKNQNRNQKQKTVQESIHECSSNEYFSWSNDSLTILSKSGDEIGRCAIYDMQGKNELFSHDQYVYIGLYDYFLYDDMGNPFMFHSLSEYDDYGYEDIYSGDTLKKWFIPGYFGEIDTVYCTFERKSLVYNIVRYYTLYRHETIANPQDIKFYCGSGVAKIRMGDNFYYEYAFKDQWISNVNIDQNEDIIFLAYGLKADDVEFSELTYFGTAPRWMIPLSNTEELKSWYDGTYKMENGKRNFAAFEYNNPENYIVDVINWEIYDLSFQTINIEDIIKGRIPDVEW